MKTKILFTLILFVFTHSLSFAQTREIVRIVTYNLLRYSEESRNPHFKTVLDEIEADIVVVQEITSQYAVNVFRSGVLGDDFEAGPFISGPDTESAIFFKDSLLTLISHNTISTTLRNISEFKLYHNFSLDTFYIYSVHLKASQGSDNEQRRLQEVTQLRNVTDLLSLYSQFMVLGDFNIYHSGEPAYQKLINDSTSGYFLDSQIAGSWHNNGFYASLHTQSTCGGTNCPNGGAGGGLDDRFDMILTSQSVTDTGGVTLIEESYTPFGNDGAHFNVGINTPPYTIITQEVANALYNASDHLPVYADFDFGIVTDVEEIAPEEMTFVLYQNYPNPFNPVTTIRFEVPISQNVELAVFDMLGRQVKVLFNDMAPAGIVAVDFNAEGLSSGVYFYRLKTENFVESKKLLLLK